MTASGFFGGGGSGSPGPTGPAGPTGATGATGATIAAAYARGTDQAATSDPTAALGSGSIVTSLASANLYLSAFASPFSWTSTGIRINVTSASGTSVTGGIGLYSLDTSDNGTLIANVAASTTVFHTLGVQTINWVTPVALTAGNRYAVGYIANGTNPGPSVQSNVFTTTAAENEFLLTPMIGGILAAQASLPGSFTKASLVAPTVIFYGVLL